MEEYKFEPINIFSNKNLIDKKLDENGLVHRFSLTLPTSDSKWGKFDVLNNKYSSEVVTKRVNEVIGKLEKNIDIFIAMRGVIEKNHYTLPLNAFESDPSLIGESLDDFMVAISGPLRLSEAIASGYLLESAAITKDILEGFVPVINYTEPKSFTQIIKQTKGERRFLPLGWFTIYDYIARMMRYRAHLPFMEELEQSEDNTSDMSMIVGLGVIPLARAFRLDGYKIGDTFERYIDKYYIGNQQLFIPFAGIFDGMPKTSGDWELLGVGLYTGVRLYKILEKAFTFRSLSEPQL